MAWSPRTKPAGVLLLALLAGLASCHNLGWFAGGHVAEGDGDIAGVGGGDRSYSTDQTTRGLFAGVTGDFSEDDCRRCQGSYRVLQSERGRNDELRELVERWTREAHDLQRRHSRLSLELESVREEAAASAELAAQLTRELWEARWHAGERGEELETVREDSEKTDPLGVLLKALGPILVALEVLRRRGLLGQRARDF